MLALRLVRLIAGTIKCKGSVNKPGRLFKADSCLGAKPPHFECTTFSRSDKLLNESNFVNITFTSIHQTLVINV